jgi:TM2 domain-containing membrane protein YozV
MTMIDRRFPPDEEHRSEPEIIPPRRADGSEPESTFWVRDVERGSHRVYVTKIGRFGLLPFFVLGGIILIALLIFVLGAFLILIPVAGVVIAAAIIAGLLRGYPRWPR